MRPTIDHTQEFKKLVSVADPGGSNAARRERQRQIERGNAGAAGGGGKKSSEDAARRRRGEQEWIAEAYRIVSRWLLYDIRERRGGPELYMPSSAAANENAWRKATWVS